MSVFGPKWAIFDSFAPKMAKTGFFWKNPKMSLYAATLCKKPEQTYEWILRSRTDKQTDGRTNKSEFVGPNCAPRGTNQHNPMTGFGEIDQNDNFWAKMGYF